MRVLNFGSLNIDYVYQVPHFVSAGETLASDSLERFCGGKGMNQSVALAKAGLSVYHAGCIGSDGLFLKQELESVGVDVTFIKQVETPSGHAIIQVDSEGQNCILLFGGANQCITKQQVDETLQHFEKGDMLLLQNEMNNLTYLIEQASEKGMQIAFNPSPFADDILSLPLDKIDVFLLNEIEGKQLTHEAKPQRIIATMQERFPNAKIVLTLGKDGVLYYDSEQVYSHPIFPVPVVDTTAAGDTFTGYFLQGYANHEESEQIIRRACAASAIAITKPGAMPSVPTKKQVDAFLAKHTM